MHKMNLVGRVGWRKIERFEKHLTDCPHQPWHDSGAQFCQMCECGKYNGNRPYRPVFYSAWNETEPAAWERIKHNLRRPELVEAYRAMIDEQGLIPCDYQCSRKARRRWERSESERIRLSAKRQYRALKSAEMSGKAYRPKKAAKGVQALPTFHACERHIPAWRDGDYKMFSNVPNVTFEEYLETRETAA